MIKKEFNQTLREFKKLTINNYPARNRPNINYPDFKTYYTYTYRNYENFSIYLDQSIFGRYENYIFYEISLLIYQLISYGSINQLRRIDLKNALKICFSMSYEFSDIEVARRAKIRAGLSTDYLNKKIITKDKISKLVDFLTDLKAIKPAQKKCYTNIFSKYIEE